MGWVLISSVFFPATLLSSASSSYECCFTVEGGVWVSRGAYWDTELSQVYRSVDTPPQGKPSVDRRQGFRRRNTKGRWGGSSSQRLQHNFSLTVREPLNTFNSPLQASWVVDIICRLGPFLSEHTSGWGGWGWRGGSLFTGATSCLCFMTGRKHSIKRGRRLL
jgi:hypothetical protein